jgi:CheY-like chemotaxis protein
MMAHIGFPIAHDREQTLDPPGTLGADATMPLLLIVDDYADALELLDVTLTLAGYRTVRATNGADAVAVARAHRPAAVVMDLFLPQLDGSDAARAIRQIPGLEDLPIIGYTARSGRLEDDDAVFDRVLGKPCSPDVLLATVSELLRAANDELASART